MWNNFENIENIFVVKYLKETPLKYNITKNVQVWKQIEKINEISTQIEKKNIFEDTGLVVDSRCVHNSKNFHRTKAKPKTFSYN